LGFPANTKVQEQISAITEITSLIYWAGDFLCCGGRYLRISRMQPGGDYWRYALFAAAEATESPLGPV